MTALLELTVAPSAGDVGGSAESARSSVLIYLGHVCNPALVTPQEISTSGKHAGLHLAVSDAMSTVCGKRSKLKTSPTLVRFRSQLCAVDSLRDASLAQSTLRPRRARFPLRAALCRQLKHAGRLFYSEVTL